MFLRCFIAFVDFLRVFACFSLMPTKCWRDVAKCNRFLQSVGGKLQNVRGLYKVRYEVRGDFADCRIVEESVRQ